MEKTPKQKFFLYARVSIDEEVNGRLQDPELQLGPSRDQCKIWGYEIAGEFIDRETGEEKHRPQFRSMLKRLNNKEAEGLIVWKLDRLNRFKATDAMVLIDELKKRGIVLRSVMDTWADTRDDNPTSALLFFITAWIAEQEKANISMRTKAGITNKRKCKKSPTGKHVIEQDRCTYCGLSGKKIWKGGRKKGTKDSVPRKRRWLKKPELRIDELFE